MTPDDELKSAWKAQPLPRQITMNADVLLQQLRGNKARFTSEILWSAVFMILGWVVMAFGFIGFGIYAVRRGFPWDSRSNRVRSVGRSLFSWLELYGASWGLSSRVHLDIHRGPALR